MALPVWGNLEKSQIDNETIEEAIARLIQAHEDDPNAHVEAGESLQSHKASAIIDHAVASIIADKLKEWEILKIKGSLDRTDFHWYSIFESLDGFYIVINQTAAVTQHKSYIKITTGVDQYSQAIFQKGLDIMNVFTWDKRRAFRTRVYVHDNDHQQMVIVMGDGTGFWANQFVGFQITNDTLYGIVGNGAGKESVQLVAGLNPGDTFNLEAKWLPGEKAEFYVDGVLEGTIEINLPSGLMHASTQMTIMMENMEAVEKYIKMSYFDFWQEI